jgi:hypothetical protein
MCDRSPLTALTFFLLIACLIGSPLEADSGKTLWSISSFGEGGADYLHRPSDLAADLQQSLFYVVDSGNNRIVVFDLDGKFIRIIGKEGQGPGEFSQPTGAWVFEDSRLAIADYRNNRIQIFNASGGFLRNIVAKDNRIADLIVVDDLFYTVPSFGTSGFNISMGSDAKTQPLVVALDQGGNSVKEFLVHDFPETQPFVRALKHRVNLALSPDGKLYLPHANMNLIQVFDLEANKLTQFDRKLPFKPLVPQLQSQKSGENAGQKVVQMIAKLDMVSQASQFGPDGFLYILTYSVSLDKWRRKFDDQREMTPMPMRFDVIDPQTNTLLRTLDCDPGARAFVPVDAGRLVYVHEDEDGELVLKCVQY